MKSVPPPLRLPGLAAYALPLVWLMSLSFAAAQSTWVRKTSGTIDYLSSVSHGAGTYVAVGDNGTLRISADAGAWSPASSGTTANLRAVHHDGSGFVAAGSGGTILTSPDGTSWTARGSGTLGFLSGLAASGSRWVAVGAGGTIVTSPDAISWAPVIPVTGRFLQSVHHADGLFVACGEAGTILTSPDGLIWSAAISPTSSYLLGSGHFRGRHYLVGQNGVIVSSADGSNWVAETSGTLENLRAFASDGTTAVVCGEAGKILKSTDGAAWSPVGSGQTVILADVGFADGRFVIVGEPAANSGMILVAGQDPGIRWESPEVTVGEGDGTATLTLQRLGPTTAAAAVDFLTVAGSAAADLDFTTTSSTAEFAAGVASVEVLIPILNNPEAEPPEVFNVVLSNPDPASLALYQPLATSVTIIDAQDSDNDGLPDEWELTYFPNVDAYGPDDDPDSDGNPNARELADGTDPSEIGSASYRLTLGVAAGTGTVSATPDLPSYPRGTAITLTPSPTPPFGFDGWEGDAAGNDDPLEIIITSDLAIQGRFEITLTEALDDPALDWSLAGSGAAWVGQATTTSDGIDAAATGGLTLGQESSLQTTVYGPANVNFHWRVSAGNFDRLRFFVGGSPRLSVSGQSGWQSQGSYLGSGTWPLRWTYSKESTSTAGTNQAWLDKVSLDYGYEVWKGAFFSPVEQGDAAISGPEADPDLDGLANAFEYLFNLPPRSAGSAEGAAPVIRFLTNAEGTFPALEWSRHRFRDPYVVTLIEFSETLLPESWQTLAEPLEILSTDGAMEKVRMSHPAPLDSLDRGFFRLSLNIPTGGGKDTQNPPTGSP